MRIELGRGQNTRSCRDARKGCGGASRAGWRDGRPTGPRSRRGDSRLQTPPAALGFVLSRRRPTGLVMAR